jgi:hypothetical protein
MAAPMADHSERLSVEPSASACGKEVGQPVLVNPVALSVKGAPQAETVPCSDSPNQMRGTPSRGAPTRSLLKSSCAHS